MIIIKLIKLSHFLSEQMTSFLVSVWVLGIGIVRSETIGYRILGAELGIVLILVCSALFELRVGHKCKSLCFYQ